MKLNLTDKVFKCLKQSPEQRFLTREIAEWIFETYPEECRKKRERSQASVRPLDSDDKAFITQLSAEIGAHNVRIKKKYPQVKTIEGRPRKFYYTEASDDEEIEQVEVEQTAPAPKTADKDALIPLNEQALYQKLSDYLFSEDPTIYTKRIDEKQSRNSRGANGNKWLYPDLVGVEVLNENWVQEIKECVKVYSDKKTKLWSFEVKLKINRSNLREAFFQTVSNSSWANFGYLVASEVRDDAMSELRILTSLHGIGFILLDVDDLSNSQILIPAKERAEIDWNTANRLAEENTNFEEYIQHIRQFYQTDVWKAKDWDGKKLD